MARKTEIIEEEMIKPTSPTPNHLRTLKLSIFDHFIPPDNYVATVFFYDACSFNREADDDAVHEEIICQKLKNSLSETLTRFYPLAGRIEGVSINCNDEGAVFTKARIDLLLKDFLRNPDAASLEQFIPGDIVTSGEPPETWPLLIVRVSFFRCGGLAIGVCVSHKICDAASLAILVRGWTATARGCSDVVSPEFTSATVYPPADHSFQLPSTKELSEIRRICLTNRFVFNPSKIAELKSRVSSECVPDPTRVEAIAALIWKCATKASRSNSVHSGNLRPSVLMLGMDLRLRVPPTHLSGDAIGNLISLFVLNNGPESEMEINEIVTKLRRNKDEFNEMIKENLRSEGATAAVGKKITSTMFKSLSELRPEMDIYATTSWCRMGFYEADFGWGSPLWVAADTVSANKKLVVVLMDAKDGEGIEAWVTLPELEMPAFEQDPELLAFASPNPSVLTEYPN